MRLIILVSSLILIAEAKIIIDIAATSKSDVSVNSTGVDVKIVDETDLVLHKLDKTTLLDAVKIHYGRRPSSVFLKSPTPWGDLYKTYNWEQVSRVLTVQSARIKGITKKPVVLLSHDFDNLSSNNTIKVNTGISQTVENTVTTSWSKVQDLTISQEIEYDINVVFAKLQGTTGLSHTTSWGRSEEKTQSVTVGSTSSVETELSPGQSVTATLSANRGYLEVEVVYLATLRGNVAVNFKKKYKGHHFWGPPIENILKDSNIENGVRVTEWINVSYYTDASLVVYDKQTGLPL